MTLSPQQQKLIEHLANGARVYELPELMGITQSAVNGYIRNVKCKLGALTKEHAVAIAIRKGLVK